MLETATAFRISFLPLSWMRQFTPNSTTMLVSVWTSECVLLWTPTSSESQWGDQFAWQYLLLRDRVWPEDYSSIPFFKLLVSLKLTPSWTRAFHVCSSFLMNLNCKTREKTDLQGGKKCKVVLIQNLNHHLLPHLNQKHRDTISKIPEAIVQLPLRELKGIKQ